LHRQFGIVNFKPLKPYFIHIHLSAYAELPLAPNTSDISIGLRRNPESTDSCLPVIGLTLNHCHDFVKQAYLHCTKGSFQDAINLFRKVLHIIPLLMIRTNDELKDVRSTIKTCSQYINALRVKLEADNTEDIKRKFELNCYFTHYELQDSHLFSGLFATMKIGYNAQYFKTTAIICRRLLEIASSGRVNPENAKKYVESAQKVLKKCETKNEDIQELEYKPHDFTQLCALSMKPILRGEKTVKSPYDQTVFKAEFEGQLSPTCELVRIGGNATGVTINVHN